MEPRSERGLELAPAAVNVERRGDGCVVLRSPRPLGDYAPTLGVWLDHWAEAAPDRTLFAERDASGGWRRIGYRAAARAADAVAQALLDRGLDPSRPVMVLSGNGVDHALLALGCLRAGVPVVPVSPAYSLMSEDLGKLRYIQRLIRPALVFVDAVDPFRAALAALDLSDAELVASAPSTSGPAATPLSELLAAEPTAAVRRRVESLGASDVAKVLFTSGSTGPPKGVVNTHGMLAANQQMIRECWPFLERVPPVLVDWLPWNHTFGGNHNFNLVLRNGGTLYVDGGKPTPSLIGQTLRNLREVSPTIYFNVPAGYAALLGHLETDDELARGFLRELELIFYAAAALPQDLWERLERLSLRHLGRKVPMTSAWGCTETAPMATSAHYPLETANVIGLPPPGVELKLVPSGSRLELRVRGPNVTPGYYERPELTREAFDDEGFYRTGDAGRFVDPAAPEKGLAFDGRTAEDFKLTTGTWVHVGALRVAVLAACSPLLTDLVVCGHDRPEVGALAWPDLGACRSAVGSAAPEPPAELLRAPELLLALQRSLAEHNRHSPGSSTRVRRLLLMSEPPSIDRGEITDKGYINQRAALECRADLVARLFADPPGPGVVVVA